MNNFLVFIFIQFIMEEHPQINRSAQLKGVGIQCTHCKVFRLAENFIGKTGGTVKRCLSCRENDDKHKKDPAVVAKRNAHQRVVRRDIACRQRQREQNETAYLEKNARQHNEWYHKNKESVAEFKTKNFSSRFGAITPFYISNADYL